MASETFFASGSADLSPSGRNILAGVAEQIVQPRYAGYTVTVEGHTDDNPIATALFPSNWELSAARAAAVVRFLAERGVDSTRLRAAGFADSLPLAANRDSSGRAIPENQARNRRVVIRLERVG
jgi:chemotaxis protein MotB